MCLVHLARPGFAAAAATAGAFGSSLFVAAALGLSQCFSFTIIPTGSMEPTLMPGDVVLQDRFFTGTAWGRGAFPPARGDIVFFTPPPALLGLVEDTAAKAGARGPVLDTRQVSVCVCVCVCVRV